MCEQNTIKADDLHFAAVPYDLGTWKNNEKYRCNAVDETIDKIFFNILSDSHLVFSI